ncbi:MAG: hypothetical protein IKC14_09110 [Kiritimatiellae bacterium]|nr:hypothetical protein [Kiritimatiellia bacterium]
MTFDGIVAALGITRSTIQKHIANLKTAGRFSASDPTRADIGR